MVIPNEFTEMINTRIRQIERLMGITVIFWSLRGSLDIGIYRNNSDADIICVYTSQDKGKRAFHDIVGHGLDIWGWIFEDAIETIKFCSNNKQEIVRIKQCAITNEHIRGSLSYYFGIFVMLGNPFSVSVYNNESIRTDLWQKVYHPKIVLLEMQSRLEKTYRKVKTGEKLNGNECIYSLWYVLMEKSVIDQNLPGDNKIHDLLDLYADDDLKEEFQRLHILYKRGSTKKGQMFCLPAINSFVSKTYENAEQILAECSSPYKIQDEVLVELCDYYMCKI